MMIPGHLIVLDPGIDGTGVAVFRPGTSDPAAALAELGLYTSDESASIEARILEIVHQLRGDVARFEPCRIAIEIPRYTGTYGRHAKAGRSMASVADGVAKLNRLIGGLVTAASLLGVACEIVEPDGLPRNLKTVYKDAKAFRRAVVQQALRRAARGKSNVPGWGIRTELSNEDKIDAVWLGFRILGGPQLSRTLHR